MQVQQTNYTTLMETTTDLELRHFPHSGDKQIAVRSLTTGNTNAPHLMFCGGFHSAMVGTKATVIHDLCEREGWSFTRFDYRGHAESEGDPHEFTLQDWLADTLAVFDEQNKPTVLIGSSMGAWLATLVALQRPQQVTGLLLLAAAPDFLQELIAPNLGPSEIWDLQQGQAVALPSRYDESSHPITQALLDSGLELSLLSDSNTSQLRCPVRLVHGTNDEDVPYTLSLRLMEKLAGDDALLTLINQADHRLSDSRCLEQIEKILCELVSQ